MDKTVYITKEDIMDSLENFKKNVWDPYMEDHTGLTALLTGENFLPLAFRGIEFIPRKEKWKNSLDKNYPTKIDINFEPLIVSTKFIETWGAILSEEITHGHFRRSSIFKVYKGHGKYGITLALKTEDLGFALCVFDNYLRAKGKWMVYDTKRAKLHLMGCEKDRYEVFYVRHKDGHKQNILLARK